MISPLAVPSFCWVFSLRGRISHSREVAGGCVGVLAEQAEHGFFMQEVGAAALMAQRREQSAGQIQMVGCFGGYFFDAAGLGLGQVNAETQLA